MIVGIYQYAQLQLELVNAYTTKPASGHSWSEMECTEGLCVTSGNKVGIGTDNPTEKLQVAGSIKVTGDICNSVGNCLSALAHITNSCGTAAKTYSYTDTALNGTYCFLGNPTPAAPSFPAAGASTTWTCPVTSGSPISCTANHSPAPNCGTDYWSEFYQCSGNQPQRYFHSRGLSSDGTCYDNGSWQNYGSACTPASSGVTCQTGGGCSNGVCVPVTNITNYAKGYGCTDTCKGCSSGQCVSLPVGTADTGCNSGHYRCDGSGGCTSPVCTPGNCISVGTNCATLCPNGGYHISAAGYWHCCGAPSSSVCNPVVCTYGDCACYDYP